MTLDAGDILDDLFHGCALDAFLEQAAGEQGWPDVEATRRRAYQIYEECLAVKNGETAGSRNHHQSLATENQPGRPQGRPQPERTLTMIYHVHIYREMRLKFDGIEARTPEAAAEIARDMPTDQADEIDDCDGVTLTALVDEAGDDEYERSVTVEFEYERERKASAEMLIALRAFIEADQMAEECGEWKWENLHHAFALARTAIANAGEQVANSPRRAS